MIIVFTKINLRYVLNMDIFFHIILSILLHVVGLSTGLWIWYIFPYNVSFLFKTLQMLLFFFFIFFIKIYI